MFVDRAVVRFRAGKGGNGCESFEKRAPRKFYPHGGDGGKGGDIIIRADANIRDLEYFKFNPVLEALAGQQGSSNRKTGKNGIDHTYPVPVGTIVINKNERYLIRDLMQAGEEVVVVRGGAPGRGNQDNRTRTFGKEGETLEGVLEYCIPADIALIGLANSGKTTLLATLTRAKVQSHEYPFSSRVPHLGSIAFDDYTRVTICDLPSLIKGASEGKGIGNAFLKHALRARLLYIALEPVSPYAENIEDAFSIIYAELAAFSPLFKDKPYMLILTKHDIHAPDAVTRGKERLKKNHKYVYNITAKNGEGIEPLLATTKTIIESCPLRVDIQAYIQGTTN